MRSVTVTQFEPLYLVLHPTATDAHLESPALTLLLKLSLSELHMLAQEFLTSILQATSRYLQSIHALPFHISFSFFSFPAQLELFTEMKPFLTARSSAMEQVHKRVIRRK